MTTLAEKIAARRGTGQTLAEKMAQRQAEQSPVGDAVEQAATRARDVYGVAQTLRLPLATVEANYDRLQADLPPDLQTSSSVLRWVEQHGGTPPHNVLMPQPPIPAQQNQIGVIEQITRMDGLDWAGRLPFIGSFASSEIPIAALRLQADQYETEFQANMERLEGQTTSGRMEAMPSRTSAEQRRRTRLSQTPEQLRQRDIDLVTTYLLKQQEVAERGQTFGARVFDGASYLPAWMIEFALTGGLNKLGNETAKEIGLRTLQGYAKTSGGQAVLRAAGWTGGVITRTTLGMPTRIGEAILERRIQSMALDETGNVVIEINPESWGTSVLKGYMHTLIEVGTEEAGDSILRPVGAWIGRNTLGRLPFAKGLYDQMRRAYTALHPDATDFASRFFDAAKFDGLLAEMGEERLATILHAVVGTEDFGLGPDSGPLERLEAGLRQDLANLPVEAATLAIPGATAALARQRSVPNEIDRLARTMHQANDQVSVDDYKQRIEKLIQPDADPAEVTRKAAEELYRLDPSQTVEQWQAQLAPEEATDEPAEPVPPVAEEKTGQTPAIGEPVPDYKAFADGVEAEKIEPPVPTPDAMRKAAPTWLSHMVTPELAEQWARGEAGDQAVVDAALAFRKEPATGKRVSDELDIIENADGSRTVRSETMGRETNFGMASHQDAYNYAQEQALGELADARLEAQWATYQAASRVPGREPSITLQQITEAVANDNTEGLIAGVKKAQDEPTEPVPPVAKEGAGQTSPSAGTMPNVQTDEGAGRSQESPSPQRPGETSRVALLPRTSGATTYYDLPVEYVPQEGKIGLDVRIREGGHVQVVADGLPSTGDVNVSVRKAVRDHFKAALDVIYSEKYGPGYWRFTNNAKEASLARKNDLRPSQDWRSNQAEAGLSVNTDLAYSIHGMKYAYRVDGPVVGTGADGEPVLDVANLTVRKSFTQKQTQDLVAADPQLLKDVLAVEGWTIEQYRAASTGIVIKNQKEFQSAFDTPAGQPAPGIQSQGPEPSERETITLQQITEAVANDNTEGLLADFEIDQPDPAAVHREFRTWARGRLPAVIRRKLRALGEAGIESPLDAAELTPENKERLAIEHAINMAYRLDESVTPTEPSAAEVKASLHEDAAAEATQALNAFFSQPDPSDVTPTEPTRQQMRGLKRLMKRLGLAKIEGYDVLSEKDYRDIFKYLQMPDDVRRTFPAFDKVYQVQKARETAKAVLDRVFAEKLKPYFDLPRKQQLEVDQLLVSAEQNRTDLKAILAKIDKKQHDAYKAVRESLDYAAELLVDKMVELGVNEEWINEFRSRIGYYIPHKWYGAWRIVAKDKITKKTVAMSGADRRDRQREADRLQSLYPDAKVTIIKASKLPFDAYQDVTFTGMVEMVDKVVEIANKKQGTEMTDDQAQILQDAWRQLWKEKGFGMHFIQRQETPGYTEDLRRPLAEYFTGFAGYLTKMEAGLKFPEALADIDGKRTPNLYKYASEYIRYVMGDEAYWGRFKTLMYYKYLYGNAKSAAVNLSANLMLGWPELAKVTRFSLPKILWSQARYATRQLSAHQNAFLEAYRKAGHSDAKLAAEISAFGSNAVFMASIRGAKKLLTWADLFRHAETFNRESMALALYDVGYAEGENDRLTKIAETVEAAHFRYSKGNRPTLWRGRAGAALTFRSYTVNYLTWMKNQVKEKQWGPLARSLAVWTLIGGLKATPWGALAAGLYRRVVKRDPEDDLEEAVGEHIAKTVMRGAPSQVGVSLTGSVAMLDLLPELRQGQDWRIGLTKWMAGVGGSVADQAENVVHDLQTGQYGRALEDAAPEVLRNPLAAYRMSQGARTRAGAPLIDVTTREPLKLTGPEAVLKGFGFQPDRINRGYEQMRLAEGMQAARRDTLKHWAERFNLALLNGDEQARAQILLEVADYNRQIETRKQWDLRIEPAELLSRVRALQRPANLPTERELETYLRLYGVPEEKE